MEKLRFPEIKPQTVRFKYEHFWQNSKKYRDIKSQFPNYLGICWFACYAMAIQALNPEQNQKKVISDLKKATFETYQDDVEDLLIELRDSGQDVQAFFDKQRFYFIDPKIGGLSTEFILEHPQSFSYLANGLLKKNGINAKYEIIPPDIKQGEEQRFVYALRDLVDQGKVPIIGLNIVSKKQKGIIANHVIMVGGRTPDGIIFSDPNLKKPYEVKDAEIMRLLYDGLPINDDESMYLDFDAGIQVLSKPE